MSLVGYPYHHDSSQCTIVHWAEENRAEDYCTVCHDGFMCAGVMTALGNGKAQPRPDWATAVASCPHPVTTVSEYDARDDAKRVPPGHLDLANSACAWEHHQVPGTHRTGEFWHDTAIVYDRCTGCGSTHECVTVRYPDRTCPHITEIASDRDH